MDPLIRLAITVYVLCGVLVAMKNAQSPFAKRQLEKADRNKVLFWHFIGFVLGVLLWPLGLIPVAWIMEGRKKKDGR